MLFSQQDPVLDLGWYRSMAQDVIDVFVDRTETRLYKWVARPVKTWPSMMRTVSRRSYELCIDSSSTQLTLTGQSPCTCRHMSTVG